MLNLPLTAVLIFSISYITCTFVKHINGLSQLDEILFKQYYEYAVRYKKKYLNNSTEFNRRFDVFKDNVARAKAYNKAYNVSHQPVYGINKFADLTPEEFKTQYLTGLTRKQFNIKKVSSAATTRTFHIVDIPQKFDWREKGVLTGIKDQGTCGACWSFSVVETMESMYAIQYNSSFSVPKLSVQEPIDCDHSNIGCKGGDICQACRWIHQNGVVSENAYPLTDHTDNCKTPAASVPRVFIKDYSCNSFLGREIEILNLLAQHGPIAAAIDATTWHNYIGGIIQFHCSANINHAVQIVGYDLSGDIPYYIIRNSWGKDFGDQGFIYVKYGENLCGLAEEVADIIVTDYQ